VSDFVVICIRVVSLIGPWLLSPARKWIKNWTEFNYYYCCCDVTFRYDVTIFDFISTSCSAHTTWPVCSCLSSFLFHLSFQDIWPVRIGTFSTFRIRPSGLFHIRINPELCILQRVCRTSWAGHQTCCKAAATYTRQHKLRRNAGRHRCLEWDSNPRSHCLSGRRHFMF
jgi:hypothetical protein